jgi:uncharacterized lipoprotein YddW (UPF0748 family)
MPAKADRLFLWVIRDALVDTLGLAAIADSARALGCTDLLVQVRGRGDAFYRSSIEPAPRSLETACPAGTRFGERPSEESLRFDPLAAAIRIAHSRGMRIHAWINVLLVGNWSGNGKRNVAVRRPDWIMRLADGRALDGLPAGERAKSRVEGLYLSPGNPEVLSYTEKVVRELVSRYVLDGLHLDYIRYPHIDAGYDEASREAFLIADLEQSIPPGNDPRMGPWDRWRMEQVSRMVQGIARTARSRSPGIEVSAAVIPDPDVARGSCKQDWPRWIGEGWLDAVFPMAYTASAERLDSWLRAGRGRVFDPDRIIPGLGLHKLDAQTLDGHLSVLAANSVRSYALFSDVELMAKRSLRDAIRGRQFPLTPNGE